MSNERDIVERLRDRHNGTLSGICHEAARDIERLRIACAGGLAVAASMTDECVKLHDAERAANAVADKLAQGQVRLRRWLDSALRWCDRAVNLHAGAADLLDELNVDRRRWKRATEDRDAEIERLHARLDALTAERDKARADLDQTETELRSWQADAEMR